MNISSNQTSTFMPQYSPSAPPEEGRAPPPYPHVSTIDKLGSSLSDSAKESLFSGVQGLQESGASFEEIKTFVDTELEANGIDAPAGHSRPGQLVDMMV